MTRAADFTLLIAGPDHGNTERMIQANKSVLSKVLISRWDYGVKPNYLSLADVVTTPLPAAAKMYRLHNAQNIYLQATTVLAGLEHVETPYVIKGRSDEFFSNLDIMIRAYNPKKLLSSNIFVRDVSYNPYHISDHLFIGRSDRLRNAFSALKKYIESAASGGGDPFCILNSQTPAEVKIGVFYLQSCGYEINHLMQLDEDGAFDIMKDEFEIFDVDKLLPLEIASSSAGKMTSYRRYIGRDSVLGLRHITSIFQMAPQGQLSSLYHRVHFKLRRLLAGMWCR